MSIQVGDIQKEHLRAALRDSSHASAGSRSGHRRVGSLMSEMQKVNSGDDLDLLDEGSPSKSFAQRQGSFPPAARVTPRDTFPPGVPVKPGHVPAPNNRSPPPPYAFVAPRQGSHAADATRAVRGFGPLRDNLFGEGRRGSIDVRPDPKSLAAGRGEARAGQAFARGQGRKEHGEGGGPLQVRIGDARGDIAEQFLRHHPSRADVEGR